ncbi:MAG: isopentenyl-diphosphate Delta-isomerase [Bacteroidetes bacterium]|nr:isopentenyl-diphosphate Delta-isomerase [Bacteroidota bacterium]
MIKSLENVVLVNEFDEPIGLMEKLEAHEKGLLHRAFSVLVFNENHEMLIQKRADSKYHSAGLWSNACCSHPRENESITEAAKRRMVEEIGLETDCHPVFHFIYKAELENNLTEYEFDHVLIAHSEIKGIINPDEVSEMKFVQIDYLRMDMILHPEKYTEWFKIIMLKHYYKLTEFLDLNILRV